MTHARGKFRRPTVAAVVAALLCCAGRGSAEPAQATIRVFENAEVSYRADEEKPRAVANHVALRHGQVLQRTIDLPALPDDMSSMSRLVARITVEPILTEQDGRLRPGDPWTRMGSISVVQPGADLMPVSPNLDTIEDDRELPSPEDDEIEVVRFITGFGGPAVFEQDLTALAPLLSGTKTIRLYLSTWLDPGWRVSLSFIYDELAGPRRPVFAQPLFNDQSVEADDHVLRGSIDIPEGLALPRLRVLSTGHATDGAEGDEFTARTNVLRVDGRVVAMFRPWSEDGGDLRPVNPMSGRISIEGRSLWSSDLDRAGWHPGRIVEPIIIPLPELTPGRHSIEFSVRDIRPEDDNGELGYWRVSAIVVADQPWPEPAETEDQR